MEWYLGFHGEVFPHEKPDPTRMRTNARLKIEEQTGFLWEDGGRPVSTAATSHASAIDSSIRG